MTENEFRNKIQIFFSEDCNNRNLKFKEIQQEFKSILVDKGQKLKYFCPKCKRIHMRGKIYEEHKNIAFLFPVISEKDLKIPNPNQIFHLEIVGIYYTRNGNYIRNLPQGTFLTMIREPSNSYDSHAVSIWHNNKKLGYLPRYKNEQIFKALKNHDVKCILGNYRASRVQEIVIREEITRANYGRIGYNVERERYFSPERAQITVEIEYPEKIIKQARIYLDASKNIPYLRVIPIVKWYKQLGYHGLIYLQNHIEKNSPVSWKKLYNCILDEYKIKINDFKVIL